MKLIMENWRSFIKEGITDVVFYKRSLSSAADILKADKFMTSVAFGTQADAAINKGKLYYLSTMRSPTGEFSKPMPSVTFQLDGRKLSEKSKAAAVDYWGPSFPTDEMEDRVFTDEPYLEPASKYITAIHVGMEIESRHTMRITRVEEAEVVENFAKSNGIPVYFYTSEKTYGILNKTKRLTLDQWKQEFEKAGGELDEPWEYESKPYMPDELEGTIEIANAIDSGDVSGIEKGHGSIWYKIKYDSGGEWARRLENAVHSTKGTPQARGFIDTLGKLLKKHNRYGDMSYDMGMKGVVNWLKANIKKHTREQEQLKQAAE